MDKIKFYVEAREGPASSILEENAMLAKRIENLDYQQEMLDNGVLGYGFRSEEASVSHLLYRVDSMEELDSYIKADPQWAHLAVTVIPVTTTAKMIKEVEANVASVAGKVAFTDDEMEALDKDTNHPAIDAKGVYTLAAKKLKQVSALVGEDIQSELWQRTLASQKMHMAQIEFSDHNPVGRPEGLLIAKGDATTVEAHVASSPIYPDTDVTYTPLLTLYQAWELTTSKIEGLNRVAPISAKFQPI